jgi:uncharacterized membrane protein YkvA (DUF1232 family)
MGNDKRPVIYDENLGFFRNLILQARLVWLLLRDARVPVWLKALPVGALAYVIMPADLFPDLVIGLGQVDDVAAVVLGFGTFISLCPPDVVEEHMQSLTGQPSSWEVQKQTPKKSVETSGEAETNVIDGSYTEPSPEDRGQEKK